MGASFRGELISGASASLACRLDIFEKQKKQTALPVRELRQVSLQFEHDAVGADYDRNELGFVANLIGHEGRGSVLSLLKALVSLADCVSLSSV